jgi:hypothetical protein
MMHAVFDHDHAAFPRDRGDVTATLFRHRPRWSGSGSWHANSYISPSSGFRASEAIHGLAYVAGSSAVYPYSMVSASTRVNRSTICRPSVRPSQTSHRRGTLNSRKGKPYPSYRLTRHRRQTRTAVPVSRHGGE